MNALQVGEALKGGKWSKVVAFEKAVHGIHSTCQGCFLAIISSSSGNGSLFKGVADALFVGLDQHAVDDDDDDDYDDDDFGNRGGDQEPFVLPGGGHGEDDALLILELTKKNPEDGGGDAASRTRGWDGLRRSCGAAVGHPLPIINSHFAISTILKIHELKRIFKIILGTICQLYASYAHLPTSLSTLNLLSPFPSHGAARSPS